MKKIVLCLLLSVMLLPVFGKAEASVSTGFDLDKLAEDTVFLARLDDPQHAILGLERNADEKRFPASTTKIMTCILALECSDPDETVKVSKRACNLTPQNSKMGLKPGDRFRMIDLLYGLMLPSGNDAAIAIAEHIGGSIEGFADLMNKKAATLGMTGTHFMNPHGLHHAEHYTTARDLAVLSAYAMENDTFREIVSTAKCTVESKDGRKLVLRNANRLLRDITASTYEPYSCLYANAIGIKTGDTHLAGKCLVAAAQKNDTIYLLVLLNGKTAPAELKGREKDQYAAQRFFDAAELFEYAFANDTVTVQAEGLPSLPDTYAVKPDPAQTLATEALYRIEWEDAESLTLPRWQASVFLTDPFPEKYLHYDVRSFRAPIGEPAGTVTIEIDGETVFRGTLIADDYTFPPTPEPTETPVYTVVEDTPSPTPSFIVTETPGTVVGSEPPANRVFWLFRLFRCAPDR